MRINDLLELATVAVADIAANGPIGTAAATVDIASSFAIAQATASVSLTLPNPTTPKDGRVCWVHNVGTATFTIAGQQVAVGSFVVFVWSNGAWCPMASQPSTAALWIDVTGPTTGVVDGQYRITGAHTFTFPANPAANSVVRMVPANSNWLSLGNDYDTTDGATIAAGQIGAISASNAGAMLLWMYEPAVGPTPANWRVFA